jgi:hypothetical protein
LTKRSGPKKRKIVWVRNTLVMWLTPEERKHRRLMKKCFAMWRKKYSEVHGDWAGTWNRKDNLRSQIRDAAHAATEN